jgi:Flp pilus assembly protein TadG
MSRPIHTTSKRTLTGSSALSRLARNERGGTLIMFAAALGLVVTTAGAAVDIGRRSLAQEELASAVDAAALAACRAFRIDRPLATMQEIQTEEATAYLNANFNWARYDLTPQNPVVTFPTNTSVQNSTQQIQSTVKTRIQSTVELPTKFLGFIGFDNFVVRSVSECTRSQGGIELTMVLDTTGSMDSNLAGVKKITSLRRATVNMINLLFNSQETSNFIRVNILPYSQTVNVGRLIPAAQLETNPNDTSYVASNTNWLGCILERPTVGTIGFNSSGNSITNYTDANADAPALAWDLRDVPGGVLDPLTSQIAPKWQPYLEYLNKGSVTRNENAYYWRNSRWELTATMGAGGSPVKYTLPTKLDASGGRGGCPGSAEMWNGTQTRAQLANDSSQTRTALVNRVNNSTWLKPGGYTYSDVGMMWGVRMMTNGAPFESAILPEDRFSLDTANPFQGWVKAILLMTDGVIDTGDPMAKGKSSTNTWDNEASNYTAYGFRMQGNTVVGSPRILPNTMNDFSNVNDELYDQLINAHEHRLLVACRAARRPAGWTREEDAIRVYTVFFGSSSEVNSKRAIYTACAGRDGRFVNAQNEAELNETFSNIASDLQNLRLSL